MNTQIHLWGLLVAQDEDAVCFLPTCQLISWCNMQLQVRESEYLQQLLQGVVCNHHVPTA